MRYLPAVCLCLLLFFCTQPASAELVGYWSFDDETADDLSGKENHGEPLGVEFSSDVPFGDGSSLDIFDGSTVQIAHSDSLGMEESLTIAFWMKADNGEQPSDWNGPLGKISNPREDGGWEMQRFANESRLDLRIDTTDQANSVVGALTGTFDEEWVHVAWVVDGGAWEAYFDGEFASSGEYPHGDGFGNEGDLFFGNRANCCNYVGLLDEIAIWDTPLAESEIAALADGQSPIGEPVVRTPGDYDSDGDLDVADIDALIGAINGDMNISFDENGDNVVDDADLSLWISDLKGTWIGDANLDGEFNTSDFVGVFQEGKFETGEPASWAQGDWNGDGMFGTGDFVVAFQGGGFEQGPRAAVASVPEPGSLALLLLGLAPFCRRYIDRRFR